MGKLATRHLAIIATTLALASLLHSIFLVGAGSAYSDESEPGAVNQAVAGVLNATGILLTDKNGIRGRRTLFIRIFKSLDRIFKAIRVRIIA